MRGLCTIRRNLHKAPTNTKVERVRNKGGANRAGRLGVTSCVGFASMSEHPAEREALCGPTAVSAL